MNKTFTFAVMLLNDIYSKVLGGMPLSFDEALFLYNEAPPAQLFSIANSVRNTINRPGLVSWQIDRNVNYTNVCISGCLFCNFHCRISQKDLIREHTLQEYRQKIDELFSNGGDQLLLQGGLHPHYGIEYYEELFKNLKAINPLLKLNALGPPEIAHIAKISSLSVKEVLERLIKAGLNSLPGAGAEILNDRVRSIISPAKPSAKEWCNVMREAHKLSLSTTATMVYGHIERVEERIEHLITLREIQDEKPKDAPGFRAFICWPMQLKGTKLEKYAQFEDLSAVEHLKMVAISRIILTNIPHIQVSWLTIGKSLAQVALHCGADDMGSVMMEENVVSSAGANNSMNPNEMKARIREAGFVPWLRNQDYTPRQEAN